MKSAEAAILQSEEGGEGAVSLRTGGRGLKNWPYGTLVPLLLLLRTHHEETQLNALL